MRDQPWRRGTGNSGGGSAREAAAAAAHDAASAIFFVSLIDLDGRFAVWSVPKMSLYGRITPHPLLKMDF
jgi:hypothetical protein